MEDGCLMAAKEREKKEMGIAQSEMRREGEWWMGEKNQEGKERRRKGGNPKRSSLTHVTWPAETIETDGFPAKFRWIKPNHHLETPP